MSTSVPTAASGSSGISRSWPGRSGSARRAGGGGFIFKGSGFYATDYRSESYTKAAKAEKDAASPPKAESAPKTETPPKKDKKADTAASK